jgi:hypothetical protein
MSTYPPHLNVFGIKYTALSNRCLNLGITYQSLDLAKIALSKTAIFPLLYYNLSNPFCCPCCQNSLLATLPLKSLFLTWGV